MQCEPGLAWGVRRCLGCSPLGCTNYIIQIWVRSFCYRITHRDWLCLLLFWVVILFLQTSVSCPPPMPWISSLSHPSTDPWKVFRTFPHLYAVSHSFLTFNDGLSALVIWSVLCFLPSAPELKWGLLSDLLLFPSISPRRKAHLSFLCETFLYSYSDGLLWFSEAAWPLSCLLSFGTLHVLLWALLAVSLGAHTVTPRRESLSQVLRQPPWPNHFK